MPASLILRTYPPFFQLNSFKCNNIIHTLAWKKINNPTLAIKVMLLFITGITGRTKEIKSLLILNCYLVGFHSAYRLAHKENFKKKKSSFSHVTSFKLILDVVPGMPTLMMVNDNVNYISLAYCQVSSWSLLTLLLTLLLISLSPNFISNFYLPF